MFSAPAHQGITFIYYEGGRMLMRQRLQRALKTTEAHGISEVLQDFSLADIAYAVRGFEPKDIVRVLHALPPKQVEECFSHLHRKEQEAVLSAVNNTEAVRLLRSLTVDDRTAVLADLPDHLSSRLFSLLNPLEAQHARKMLSYPERSVGRLMTTTYVAVQSGWVVHDALAHLRKTGQDDDTIHMVYVVDEKGVLLDDIPLRRLLLADPSTLVKSVMDNHYISLRATEDRTEAVHTMRKYGLFSLPVVDAHGVLVGVVTIDDILRVDQEKTTEDIQKLGSVVPLAGRYRDATAWTLYKSRVGWLAVLLVIGMFASGIISAYEEVLASTIALAFFIPALIDAGGNTGAQSATLIVRALATKEIERQEIYSVLIKELSVSALLGLSLGVVTYGIALTRTTWQVSLVVGLSMVAIIVVANLLGMFLPFVLTYFKVDPAVASAPLITSVIDAAGLIIYFTTAVFILSRLGV